MAFPPQFLDDIRARIGLADVVGRRVRLVKQGREHAALCPFHNEKTPSFTVSEEKGFFHCFGCGAHGDVIGFVMRADGLSFPEAVERLAADAGLEVPEQTPAEREHAKRQADLYDVMEKACAFFEERLGAHVGEPARDYLRGRSLDTDTIARFRLGYAPDTKTALRGALMSDTLPETMLIEAGLLIRPDNGTPYDRFRGRVIFPITDRRGRVIAFGARILGEGTPKYLNSPDTPLFNKGRVLYGMATARRAAHDKGRVIVTEGYMDVIALAKAGFVESVAPLGTALTESQLHELWRMAPEPLLCFDGDNAGQRAAWRAAERALPLLEPGRSLRFVMLPRGEDPDRAEEVYELDRCIECGCCVAGCGTIRMRSDFVGAVGINKIARFELDPRDNRTYDDFYELIGDEQGVFGCMSLMGCEDVCPKDLPLQHKIAYIRRKLVTLKNK